jgi:hypothetical protein
VIRPCAYCVFYYILCSVSEASDYYIKYYRTHRRCELVSFIAEVERLIIKAEVLRKQRLEAKRKAIRLRKQERALYKKIRELGDREDQNILNLEAEETVERAPTASLDSPELPNSAPTLEFPSSPAGFS